jgi:iron complex outermembrane receptor protein
MQGKVAGVNISKKVGIPTLDLLFKFVSCRFFVEPQPLYVIDGVPGVDPTTIAPEDIESFNILKDASSVQFMVLELQMV